VEKSLKELGDKVAEDEKKAIEEAITELRKAMEGDDKAEIEAKTQRLAELSANAQQQTQGEAGGSQAKSEEDVVDAEFEEVKDDQNK